MRRYPCLVIAALAALPAFAASYNLKELKPASGGNYSEAHSINATNYTTGAASDKSTLWASQWLQPGAGPIGLLSTVYNTNVFYSINATGDMAGITQFDAGSFAPILYSSGVSFGILATPNFKYGEANGVSDRYANTNALDSNTIVGAVSANPFDTDWQRAVAWTRNGKMTVLDTLDSAAGGAPIKWRNVARSIDHFGLIGGTSSKKGSPLEQPVIWGIDTSSIVTIPSVAGGPGGGIYDVRDSRYFAGYLYPADLNPKPDPNTAFSHACYWEDPTSPVDVGKPYPYPSGALAARDHFSTLNQRPELVGWRQDSTGHPTAMRWDPAHGMQDLESLVSTLGSWRLMQANDVAPDGRIVGTGTLGGQTRGFMLIPIAIKGFQAPGSPVLGGASAQASITLLDTAEQDVTIRLSSSNPAAVVPASVTVPRGSSGVTFTVVTQRVRAQVTATINATLDEQVVSARVTVSP